MHWSVYLAVKQLFPTRKRVPFFTWSAVMGVGLGVMVLIIVQTVMNGFGEKIQETLNRVGGDIRVDSGQIIYEWCKVKGEIEGREYVVGVSAYAEGVVMAKAYNRPAFPLVRGVEVKDESRVYPLREYMVMGDIGDLDEESVVVGSGLARSLGVKVGNVVEIFTPLMLEKMKGEEVLLPRELVVVGVFETGWGEVDDGTMLVALPVMQDLYGLENGVHGLSVKLKNSKEVLRRTEELRQVVGKGLRVTNWIEKNQDFLFVLKLEKAMMGFVMLFIILVASFSIASTLMGNVVRKTREVGLLGALGASGREIGSVFLLQGVIVGVAGVIVGFGLALVGLYFRNEIVGGLTRWTGTTEVLESIYQMSEVPAKLMVGDFVVVGLATLVITTLAGLLPAWKASRLKAVEALRNE